VKHSHRFILSLALLAIALHVAIASGFAEQGTKKSKSSKSSTNSATKVDLNTASEKELDTLPGVGPATAKKIIAARPYSSVEDLSKSGIPANTIKKVTPLVTVSGSSASTTASPTPTQPTSNAQKQPASRSSNKTPASSASQGSPGPGMVWVNLDSGVYHYENSRYYGKTKNGKMIALLQATG